jgi:hypothetical protein
MSVTFEVTFDVTFEVTPIRGVSQGPGLFGQVQTPGGLLTSWDIILLLLMTLLLKSKNKS